MTISRFVLLLTFILSASAHVQSVQAQNAPGPLGVTTHFSQGWPISLIERAQSIGVGSIRDSLHWPDIEKSPGVYDFSSKKTQHVTSACAADMTVLLGLEPRNPLYDNKLTAHSPNAQSAFANFVKAIADRYSGCVIAIEVGNEINGRGGMTGPAATARAASHTALLKAVYQRVKPGHPGIAILGGSTNAIGTGFLKSLFAAGALDYMDGVAIHPYRKEPEAVDWEIGRLNDALLAAGKIRPIWVTEFSRDFERPTDAAPFFLKMLSLMQGAGVRHNYWYALIDQSWFPTMGLLTLKGEEKPGSRAFAYAANHLAPLGNAIRVDHGDPTLFHFRFGPSTHILWGSRRTIIAGPNARFRNAEGALIPTVLELSDMPIIVDGIANIQFGRAEILADSEYGFASGPLSWFAISKTGAIVPLVPIDWKWTSYLGSKTVPQMIVNPAGIGPAGQYSALVRYTADRSVNAIASFCLNPVGKFGDGVTVEIKQNGKPLWSGSVGILSGKRTSHVAVALKSGDNVDLVINPNANAGGDRMAYRFRISLSAADATDC
ncbi:hypothetical protein EUU23_02655 [Sphingorhabdus sp. IMCC26285]|uniref:Asl1-like glycosyl hydrolase catalytic domain-containing protein n=1 Tax=Sphingorhabdus profundilacus TaxID=2509718 RepID=A0A6I4M2S3_9SPHN|nr:glycosyl hydrolase [Sphingorhabdus profundilacus]MVZ96605.1 hypothetical protein [Sphingorhabdus profundilacus]